MSDSSKEQIIRIVVDDQQARQRTRARHESERQEIKQTTAAQDKSDKQFVAAQKMKANAIEAFAKEYEKRIKDREKAEDQSAKASVKAHSAARQQIDADHKASVDRRKGLDAEAAKAAASARRREMQELASQHKLTMLNWTLEQKALRDKTDMVGDATKAVVGYFAAFATAGTVITGIKAMAEYFANIKRDAIDSVKEMLHFRETVLEIAAMKGQLGNSTPQTVQTLRTISRTGQDKGDAVAMRKAYEGAAQAALDSKSITESDSEKAFLEASKLQSIEGPGAGTAYGELLGTLAIEAPKGTTGDQLTSQFYKEFRISQPGKFKSFGDYAEQRQALSGYVQNGMLTGEQAASLLTAASLSSKPEEAATHLRQGMASLSADPMRMRKMKMMPGQEHEGSAEYFQKHLKADLTKQGPMELLDLVSADLDDAEAKAIKDGKKWQPHQYMMNHGINNQWAREFYMDQQAIRKRGIWGGVIKDRREEALDPKAITNVFDARVGREPVIQGRLAEASAMNTAAIRASSTEGILLPGQRQAFEQLKEQGKVQGTFEEFTNRRQNVLNRMSDNAFFGGYDTRFQLKHQENLTNQAIQMGLLKREDVTDLGGKFYHQRYAGDEAMAELTQQVQAGGGNPLAQVIEQSKRAADALERMEKKMEAPAPGQPNAGRAGAPAIPMQPANPQNLRMP